MTLLRVLLLTLAPIVLTAALAHASSAPLELYQAKPVVTGTGEKNRLIGFALAFEDVLMKVSGDPSLLDDPRVAALAKSAGSLVAEFHYRDRMEGIPIHDEQGSHDRPHDLTTLFVPDKIDAILASLGSRPWTAPRPTLVVFLGVTNGERMFMLTSDGERGVDMRDSLAAASTKVAIPAKLPSASALAAAGITVESVTADPAALDALVKAAGGDIALAGSLVWSDADLGWIADWRVVSEDESYAWEIRGVSFDDAFRNAIRGAAQVLSRNGNPG